MKALRAFILASLAVLGCANNAAAVGDAAIPADVSATDLPATDLPATDLPRTPDAASATDVPAMDATDVPSTSPCAFAPATAAGRVFEGSGPSTDGGRGVVQERLVAYFPNGRVAGAPVVVAVLRGWPRRGLIEVRATLDANRGAAGLSFTGTDVSDVSWTASLLGPDDGFAMRVGRNRAINSDVVDYVQADLRLCPIGEAPTPAWASTEPAGPALSLRLVPAVPLAADLSTVRLRAGDVTVPATVTADDGALLLRPTGLVPPNAVVSVELGGLRDLLGRAMPAPELPTLRTTAAVTDGTFAVAPPEGAVAGVAQHRDGTLVFGSGTRGPARALVALGEVPAGRVTLTLALRVLNRTDLTLALVRADGTAVTVDIPESAPGASQTLAATVGGSGPLWLMVDDRTASNRPGWLPQAAQSLVLDAVAVGP